MPTDPSALILDHVRQFTVGFAKAGDRPNALGSGVLVRTGTLSGILTCAHVEELLRERRKIGWVDFNRGLSFQAETLDMETVPSILQGSSQWKVAEPDICFIHLPYHRAGSFAANCSFLNADANFERFREPDPSADVIDAVFGLVEDFSGPTTREHGLVTSKVRGVLTPGRIVAKDDETTTLECLEQNIPDLPGRFGGTSGGGLWRVYLRTSQDGAPSIEECRLIGIASQDNLVARPPRIICQSPRRLANVLAGARDRFS
jgi:hypothetical protein